MRGAGKQEQENKFKDWDMNQPLFGETMTATPTPTRSIPLYSSLQTTLDPSRIPPSVSVIQTEEDKRGLTCRAHVVILSEDSGKGLRCCNLETKHDGSLAQSSPPSTGCKHVRKPPRLGGSRAKEARKLDYSRSCGLYRTGGRGEGHSEKGADDNKGWVGKVGDGMG